MALDAHTNTRVHPPMYEGEDRGSQANVKQNNMLSIHSANETHEHTHQCDLNPSDENAPSGPE